MELINFTMNKALINGLKLENHERNRVLTLMRKITNYASEDMLVDKVGTLIKEGFPEVDQDEDDIVTIMPSKNPNPLPVPVNAGSIGGKLRASRQNTARAQGERKVQFTEPKTSQDNLIFEKTINPIESIE